MEFSRELRNDVLAGDITLSVRLWKRPRVKQGGRYRVGLGEIEIDAIELLPFAAITEEDVRRAGEPDRETLRQRAAHAGPIDEDTLVYRIEFHAVSQANRPGFRLVARRLVACRSVSCRSRCWSHRSAPGWRWGSRRASRWP